MPLLAIDIGGTTIKYTLYDKGKLGDITSVKTPIDLESFYHCLSNIVEQAKKEHIIQGVAISSPGAVNKTLVLLKEQALYLIYMDLIFSRNLKHCLLFLYPLKMMPIAQL